MLCLTGRMLQTFTIIEYSMSGFYDNFMHIHGCAPDGSVAVCNQYANRLCIDWKNFS